MSVKYKEQSSTWRSQRHTHAHNASKREGKEQQTESVCVCVAE